MQVKIHELKETIRIKHDEVNITALMAGYKDGEYYVYVSPTFLVSGYGENENEAYKSYLHNMEVFCEDLLSLSDKKRDGYLANTLGFKKEVLKSKKFSKLYVDRDGILHGLEADKIKTSIVEIAA
ncbi:MAG: hypothetical protein LBE82_01675 [Chitinophagaceae bacterium]|jgi:hypothetical protein|nr:hypothetical protein [Chitinophagaceae bacterium]